MTNEYDKILDHLILNLYTGNPDICILPFLKNHFPYLTMSSEPGGWTMYPPEPRPMPIDGFHSIKIDKHPYLRVGHKGARLDLFTQEWPTGAPGIKRHRVWLYFSSLVALDNAKNELISDFKSVGASPESTELLTTADF
jgi:hypothetical protein